METSPMVSIAPHRPAEVTKRLLDVLLSGAALIVAAPVLAVAALGVRLASPGPSVYRARRAGRGGRTFTMYKLRTMHVGTPPGMSVITAGDDARVFPLGAWLRRTKIDELPQLLNVLRGEMSIVGPRPEDPRIVADHYAPAHRETLEVRPGLASPGSIFYFTHGERRIAGESPEAAYVDRVLAVKLALDTVYVRRASLRYDLAIIGRTLRVILAALFGQRDFPPPPEMAEASTLITPPRRSGRDPPTTPSSAGTMAVHTATVRADGDGGPQDHPRS